MKLVYICSPLRGDTERNIKKAKEYSKEVMRKGDCPIAPHCIFTQFLNDTVAEEREMGIKMGLQLLSRCDKLLVCGAKITEGMQAEIWEAERLRIPIESQENIDLTPYLRQISEAEMFSHIKLL